MPVTTRAQRLKNQLLGNSSASASQKTLHFKNLVLSNLAGRIDYLHSNPENDSSGEQGVKYPVWVKCYRGKDQRCREAQLARDKPPNAKIVPSIHFDDSDSSGSKTIEKPVSEDVVRTLMLKELQPYGYSPADMQLEVFLKDGSTRIDGHELWDIFEQVKSSLESLKKAGWYYIDVKADNVLLAQQGASPQLQVFLADIDSLAESSPKDKEEKTQGDIVTPGEDGSFKMTFTYVPKFICAHLQKSIGQQKNKQQMEFNTLENVKAQVEYWIPFLLVALVTIFVLKTFCGETNADLSSGVSLYCPERNLEPHSETRQFFNHALDAIRTVLGIKDEAKASGIKDEAKASADANDADETNVCEEIKPKNSGSNDTSQGFQDSFVDDASFEPDDTFQGDEEDESEGDSSEEDDEEVSCDDVSSDLPKCWTVMPVLKQLSAYAYRHNKEKDKMFVLKLEEYIKNLNIYKTENQNE